MPALRPRIRALAVGAGAFALVVVAAGGTFAASNPATLYACYDAYGNVRMGDTAQCKLPGGGRLVTWSTVGVPGPAGPTGATGPTGPTGPTGATGPNPLAGQEMISYTYSYPPGAIGPGTRSLTHNGQACPAGKVPINGWGTVATTSFLDGNKYSVASSGPFMLPGPQVWSGGWQVIWAVEELSLNVGTVTFHVLAMCVPLP